KALQDTTLRHKGCTRRDLWQQSGRPRWCLSVPTGATLGGTNPGTGAYDVTGSGTLDRSGDSRSVLGNFYFFRRLLLAE
ncbi:MAG: hypothetical protein FWH27_19310, partial [Planctomycetaceae bacterium]|nr:hypothetical protein [Planctomycetaceae bacterium]